MCYFYTTSFKFIKTYGISTSFITQLDSVPSRIIIQYKVENGVEHYGNEYDFDSNK